MSVPIITLAFSLLIGIFFLLLFYWAVKDGQFKDVEEAKYEMFRDVSDKKVKNNPGKVK